MLAAPLTYPNCSPFAGDPINDTIQSAGHIDPVASHMLVRAAENSVQGYQYWVTVYRSAGVNT